MNLQQILSNLFSFANSYEAIIFSVILVISMLLGILLTFLLYASPALKKKRKLIAELQSNLEMLNSKVKLNEEKYTVQVSKTKRQEEETTKLQIQNEELSSRNNKFQSEVAQLQFEKENLQHNLENCEKEISELKNLYNVSLQENSSVADRFAVFTAEKNEALARLDDYKNLVEQLEKERHNKDGSAESLNKLNVELKTDLERLEKEKNVIKEENIALKLQLNEKEQQYLESLKQISLLNEQLPIVESSESNDNAFETLKRQSSENYGIDMENNLETPNNEQVNESEAEVMMTDKTALFSEAEQIDAIIAEDHLSATGNADVEGEIPELIQLIGPSNAQADNLKLINGISQETEERLFVLGINSYEQLSRLNDESINQKLCQLLRLKEKSIEKDQWEAQARQLLIKQKINNLTRDINLSKLFKK